MSDSVVLLTWLQRDGWEVVDEDGLLRIRTTPANMIAEADQIMQDLQANFGIIFDPIANIEDGFAASIRATYDPVTGNASIEITAA